MDRAEYKEAHESDPQAEVFEDGFKEQMKIYKKCPEEQKMRKFELWIVRKDGEPMSLTDKMFIPKNAVFDSTKVFGHHQIADYDTGQTFYNDELGDEEAITGTATTISWKLCDENTKREIDDEDINGPKGKSALQQARAKKMAQQKKKAKAASGAKAKPTTGTGKSGNGDY